MSPVTRLVRLTTGYEVDVAEEDGLGHLFNAAFGESLHRVQEGMEGVPKTKEEFFGAVYDLAILELHFVAGQLLEAGSGIELHTLLDEFGVHWDYLAERINGSR